MKLPTIDRCPDGELLTAESAYRWALFLKDEADMCDDVEKFDTFTNIAEQLSGYVQKQMQAYVHYVELEKAIEEYKR